MVRLIACAVWEKHLRRGTYLSRLLEEEPGFSALDARDRAFAFELLYGTCRRRGFIRHVLSGFVKTITTPLFAVLSLGVYQILFMRSVTDYAAVSEMVDVAKKTGLKREAGLVNAVLRRIAERKDSFLRQPDESELSSVPAESKRLSYPEWIVGAFHRQFGPSWSAAILSAMNEPARLPMESLGEDPFAMSPAQKKAVMALDVRPGDSVLDLCSAPGGKARLMAHALKGRGELFCVEKNRAKLEREKSAGGWGGTAVSFLCADAALIHRVVPDIRFDRIMLDAPCSNTGEMAKRPEVRWRLRKIDIARLAAGQQAMLESASQLLKDCGTLLYATCSLMEEENKGAVSAFLKKNRSLDFVEDELTLPQKGMPFGGYYAKLIKNTESGMLVC